MEVLEPWWPTCSTSALEVRAAVHKVGLRSLFHVAGQQKAGVAVVDAQHQRGVVGLAVPGHRAQQGNGGAAQRPDGAHGGHFQLQALLLGVFDKIVEAFGAALGYGAVSVPRRELCHYGGKPAYMVLVGVGAEHILQLLHPLLLQVGDHQTAVIHVAAVVEHELSVAFHQHTQRLTHIDEMHLQGCVHRIHSRRSRSGRVRHYIGASARDGRQPAAARKAQHQCGGSGQRSKALPQAFLRRVYFFFFPVSTLCSLSVDRFWSCARVAEWGGKDVRRGVGARPVGAAARLWPWAGLPLWPFWFGRTV